MHFILFFLCCNSLKITTYEPLNIVVPHTKISNINKNTYISVIENIILKEYGANIISKFNNLTIFLVARAQESCGIYWPDNKIILLSLNNINCDYVSSLHHEIMHFIDSELGRIYEDREWIDLEKLIKYDCKSKNCSNIEKFICPYGSTDYAEDKATLFEELMENEYTKKNRIYSWIIQKKFIQLFKMLIEYDIDFEKIIKNKIYKLLHYRIINEISYDDTMVLLKYF